MGGGGLSPRPPRSRSAKSGKAVCLVPYYGLYLLCQVATGIELHPKAVIGPGLRIWHAGPVVVGGGATIGADCVLSVGNILGNRDGAEYPTLGDRVRLAVGAQVLGGVRVGDDAYVGAMTLVLSDVPDGAVVAGIPARVIRGRGPGSYELGTASQR